MVVSKFINKRIKLICLFLLTFFLNFYQFNLLVALASDTVTGYCRQRPAECSVLLADDVVPPTINVAARTAAPIVVSGTSSSVNTATGAIISSSPVSASFPGWGKALFGFSAGALVADVFTDSNAQKFQNDALNSIGTGMEIDVIYYFGAWKEEVRTYYPRPGTTFTVTRDDSCKYPKPEYDTRYTGIYINGANFANLNVCGKSGYRSKTLDNWESVPQSMRDQAISSYVTQLKTINGTPSKYREFIINNYYSTNNYPQLTPSTSQKIEFSTPLSVFTPSGSGGFSFITVNFWNPTLNVNTGQLYINHPGLSPSEFPIVPPLYQPAPAPAPSGCRLNDRGPHGGVITNITRNYTESTITETINNSDGSITNIKTIYAYDSTTQTYTLTDVQLETQIPTDTGTDTDTDTGYQCDPLLEDNCFPDPPASDDCEECENDPFAGSQNFLEYARSQFSNKFPFDIVGSGSIVNSGVMGCPKLILLNNDLELCFLVSIVGLFKYAVWTLFSIKSVSWL